MKRVLSILLSVLLAFALCAPASAVDGGQFTDVPEGAWYTRYVRLASQSNLMKGNPDGTFDPEGKLPAAQAITIAARLHNRYSSTGDYIGPEGSPWYQTYVDYAERNGILPPGAAYDYNSPICRADFALLISRALPDVVLPAVNDVEDGDIPDMTQTAPIVAAAGALIDSGALDSGSVNSAAWEFTLLDDSGMAEDAAAAAVYRLYRAGILSGNDKYGTFAPASGIKRSEVAAILSRVLDPSLRQHLELEERPVSLTPMDQLANRRSLQKRASAAELAQAYESAREIVEPLANLGREAQLYGVAIAVRAITESQVTYSMSAPHYNDPYGFFVLHTASCAGSTRATGLCLNMLGIPYEHVNEDGYTHQWARVDMGGSCWICDAFGLCCGPEPAPYEHPFL